MAIVLVKSAKPEAGLGASNSGVQEIKNDKLKMKKRVLALLLWVDKYERIEKLADGCIN